MLKARAPRELVKAAGTLAKLPSAIGRGERICDADRERAEEQLGDALAQSRITVEEMEERLDAVHAAVFEGDLRKTLTGLPAKVLDSTAGSEGSGTKPLVLRAGASGIKRDGDWVVPAHMQVKGGMGSVVLDFTEAKLEHRVVQVELKLGTGSAKLVLPDGATANVDGVVASAGAVESKVASRPTKTAPHFVVSGRTRLGSVTVRRSRSFAGLRF